MARRVANASGDASSATIWDTVTNTPTLHTSTNATVSTTGVFSPTFTAPNTTNACKGALVYIATTTTRDYTLTLQESTVNKTSVTITAANVVAGGLLGWVYFQFTTPYTFTTTTANAYRFRLTSATATGGTVGADNTTPTLFAVMAVDDRSGALGSTDNLIVCAPNNGTGYTITASGTLTYGSGAESATSPTMRSVDIANMIGYNCVYKRDITANSTENVFGPICPYWGGEYQIGSVANPVPSNINATLITNGTASTLAAIKPNVNGKVIIQGASKAYTRTTYVSGSGTSGSPLIVADPVDWAVGDEISIGTTNNSGDIEFATITTKNSSTSYVIQTIDLMSNGGFEFLGNGGNDVFASWNETASAGSVNADAANARTGGYALRLTRGASGTTQVQQLNIPVNPNTAYTLSFWTKGDGTVAGAYTLLDASNSTNFYSLVSTGVTGTTYTKVDVPFTTASNTYLVTLTLLNNTGSGSSVYFDDVTLTQTTAGLNATRTAGAPILNLTRNVVLKSNNTAVTPGLINSDTTINGYYDIDYARIEGYSTIHVAAGAGVYGSVDNVVAYRCLGNAFTITTSKIPITMSNLYAVRFAYNNTGSATAAFRVITSANNKTFNNCYVMDSTRGGFHLGAYNITLNNCRAGGTARTDRFTLYGEAGIGIVSGGSITINNSTTMGNKFGNIGLTNATDVVFSNHTSGGTDPSYDIVVASDSYDTVLFNNSTFGNATLLSNYQNAIPGTLIRFHNYQNTSNNHRWYTVNGMGSSTGTGLSDTLVRTSGSLAVRLAPETSDGLKHTFQIIAKPGTFVSVNGYLQMNSTFTSDPNTVLTAELYLPGSITADATQTLTKTSGTWLAYNIGATYAGSITSYATVYIRATNPSATVGAYAYHDDVYNGTNPITAVDVWDGAQPSSIFFEQLGDAAAVWAVSTSGLTTNNTTGKQLNDLLTTPEFLAGI